MATLKNTNIDDTGYLQLPSGTTAQRPGSPSAGMVRWNTDYSEIEGYDGINWRRLENIPRVSSNGLILHIDSGNINSYSGSGTSWADLSGNSNDGTLVNGVGYDFNYQGSLTFDGTQYTSFPTSFLPNNLFADSGGSWSVSAWFKFPTAPTLTKTGNSAWSIVGRAGGIGGSATFNLFVGSETDSTYGVYIPFKLGIVIRGSITVLADSVNTDTWNNIVVTWDGSSGNYFFNNSSTGSLNIGGASIQAYDDFYIGSNPASPELFYFEGNISQILIYDRAITKGEVFQNYNYTLKRYQV